MKKIERKLHKIDAADQSVGRISTQIAILLRGKNKPEFEPHIDGGDIVEVTNVGKLKFTGKKLEQKKYYRHSGYMGGLTETNFSDMIDRSPERVIELAVKGMLPRTPLGREMYRKLKVYAGPNHQHAAQQPKPLELTC